MEVEEESESEEESPVGRDPEGRSTDVVVVDDDNDVEDRFTRESTIGT